MGGGAGGRTGEWLLSLLRDDDAALHHCTAFTGSAGQSKAQSTNRLEPQRIVGTVVLQVNICVVMKKRTGDWRAVKGSSCVLHRVGGGRWRVFPGAVSVCGCSSRLCSCFQCARSYC